MRTPCEERESCPECRKADEIERYNQPGLPAVSYRLGTHGVFLSRMLDRLHTDEMLRSQLTTRSRDDFAIALLDAWAVAGDVLAFYQERIANEGFLRTATERRSILEMARTIGYELNPGVAASAYLAFTVDDTDPKYARAKVPWGTQVQSIPARGELPQTFETSEDFEAHVEWNELRPRLRRRQTLGIDGDDDRLYSLSLPGEDSEGSMRKYADFYLVNPYPVLEDDDDVVAREIHEIYLSGVATNLKAGELLLLVGIKKNSGNAKAVIRKIAGVEADNERNWTIVEFAGVREPQGVQINEAPSPASSAAVDQAFSGGSIRENILRSEISEEMLQAFMDMNRWNRGDLLEHVAAMRSAPAPPSNDRGVFALRERLGFFGNNAPEYKSLPVSQRKDEYYTKEGERISGEPVYGEPWDPGGWEIWKDYPYGDYYSSERYGADVFLERKVEGMGKNSWVVFDPGPSREYAVYRVDDIVERSITGFSLSGKTTGLKLMNYDGTVLLKTGNNSDLKVRNTTAHVKSEALRLSDLPVEEKLEVEITDAGGSARKSGVSSLTLDGIVLGLKNGKPVIVNGERTDPEKTIGHEIAIIKNADHSHGYTVISFEDALQWGYIPGKVTVNANVVQATHGETVSEVMGSGDGAKANQRFVLKKPPLTYIPASTTSGARSTLTVRVGVVKWGREVREYGIEWEQLASLHNIGPGKQGYIVRHDDNGDVSITFGDGKQGACLPSGQENVVATYRSGIGADGEVAADSIKLLKAGPLGIRGVINPIESSGSQEPETRDNARDNAPRTVLTMDRIVSLQDYEDFTRTFAGIGKAQAIILWNGKTDLVHVTIAGSNGDAVGANSETYKRLSEAIDTYRDRLAMVKIDTFDKRLFQVEATLLIDKEYTAEDVLPAAKAALGQSFSFENRGFGQPVTAAEVISVLHRVPGVKAVDLDKLFLTDRAYATDSELGPDQGRPPSVLPCSKAMWPEGENFQKARLLLINNDGISMKEKE
ncbi:MAG: putative baseplate assembly protein [Actinomycetota bacterium]|nr:putative baseplate assembly protein [Actinomycetota bacterium]